MVSADGAEERVAVVEGDLLAGEAEAGEAKGKAQAYRDMLIEERIVRLGTLDPAVRERVGAVSDAQTLKVWSTQVLRGDADSVRRMVETIRNVQLQ